MRMVEPGGSLTNDLQSAIRLDTFLQRLVDRSAFKQLHNYKELNLINAHVMHDNDVGMMQATACPRLAQKAPSEFFGFQRVDLIGSDEFNRDISPEPVIVGAVDNAHTATTQLREQFVAPNPHRVLRRTKYMSASCESLLHIPGELASNSRVG